MASWISFDEQLNNEVPFFHAIWVYPLFWIGVCFMVIAMITSPIGFLLFGFFIKGMESKNAKWYHHVIGYPVSIVMSILPFIAFSFIAPISWINKYYANKGRKVLK